MSAPKMMSLPHAALNSSNSLQVLRVCSPHLADCPVEPAVTLALCEFINFLEVIYDV